MSSESSGASKARFIQDLEALAQRELPATLAQLRQQSAERFRETDLPHTKMEEFRQTNLSRVTGRTFTSLAAPTAHTVQPEMLATWRYGGDDMPRLVFVDGYLSQGLSNLDRLPDGVVCGSLWDAMFGPHAAVVEQHLGKYVAEDRNAFAHLNTAFLQDGPFVYVPKNVQVETPIQVLHVTSAERGADTAAYPRALYVLGTSAEATVLETWCALGGAPYLNNHVGEVALGANAKLNFYKVAEEGDQGDHLSTLEVHQERDSHFRSFVFTLSGAVVRTQLCIALDGEGAECDLNGLYLNSGARLIDNSLNITHVKPNCNSRIGYKGVLDGKSSAVFLGKVFVHQDAQKTDSDQLSSNLLLSDSATIDTKPQLEIFADDVKCTHGATIGGFPEPVVFYFRTRGIDDATARAMLTYGFAAEVVDEIGIEPLRERLEHVIFDMYSPK